MQRLYIPCIYNNYLKVLLFKFVHTFLSYHNRIHFSVTEKKPQLISGYYINIFINFLRTTKENFSNAAELLLIDISPES